LNFALPNAVRGCNIFGAGELLYAAYFFIEARIGAANFNRGLLAADGQLAKSGWGWAIVTLVPFARPVGSIRGCAL
jgi:hypothetical protein